MTSDPGPSRPTEMRISLTRLALGTAAFAVACWWSLGTPGNDPVGGVIETIRSGAGNYADWAREGPVDGRPDWPDQLRPVAGGDPSEGRQVLLANGCGSCHVIPGIVRARGTVGPSLAGLADRAYIAGSLSNTAPNLVAYLADPEAFTPKTVMPDVGLSDVDAADAAAFLYTLTERP